MESPWPSCHSPGTSSFLVFGRYRVGGSIAAESKEERMRSREESGEKLLREARIASKIPCAFMPA